MYKRTESYGYASLPTNPCDADAAITGSRFASLGDAPFYRGSVNTGDGDTDLSWSYYVRVVWCTSTPLFGWCLCYFISSLRSCPAHRSLVSSDSPDHDPENNCTVSRCLRKAACINRPTTINKNTTCEVAYTIWLSIHAFYRVFQSRVFSPPSESLKSYYKANPMLAYVLY